MRVALLLGVVLLAGCAQIKYADGERVAIEHENPDLTQLQAQADRACLQSGGRAPAVLASDMPVATIFPSALTRHTATFRCAK